jgi:hypothetical protein
MTREEVKSCIGTIKMLQRLAYNIHGVMDVIDADNCEKIIKALEFVSYSQSQINDAEEAKAIPVERLKDFRNEVMNMNSIAIIQRLDKLIEEVEG